MNVLMKSDPKLKFVLKEFPVLGPGSLEAAKVAIAVRMQDKDGSKYLDFHRRLLSTRGQADGARARAAAKEAGADMAVLERDLKTEEIEATLYESEEIATALGISGTPSYVIGGEVVPGAVGAAALKKRVDAVRQCGKATC
jgi:protein-disulfide isomerase